MLGFLAASGATCIAVSLEPPYRTCDQIVGKDIQTWPSLREGRVSPAQSMLILCMRVFVLMQAAVKTSLVDLDMCPPFALLLAYKYYEPAIRWVTRQWGRAAGRRSFVIGG